MRTRAGPQHLGSPQIGRAQCCCHFEAEGGGAPNEGPGITRVAHPPHHQHTAPHIRQPVPGRSEHRYRPPGIFSAGQAVQHGRRDSHDLGAGALAQIPAFGVTLGNEDDVDGHTIQGGLEKVRPFEE